MAESMKTAAQAQIDPENSFISMDLDEAEMAYIWGIVNLALAALDLIGSAFEVFTLIKSAKNIGNTSYRFLSILNDS